MDNLIPITECKGTPFEFLTIEPIMICADCGKEFPPGKRFGIQCVSYSCCGKSYTYYMCMECREAGKEISIDIHQCK
jgi:hypothetical protein